MDYSNNGTTFNEMYSTLKEKEKEQISEIVNKLLGDTYILRLLERDDYYACISNLTLLKTFFALIDYEVSHDIENAVIAISTTKNRNRIRLLKFETVIVLLLRIKYYEAYKSTTIGDKIIMQMDELFMEVEKRQIFSKPKTLREYNDALKTLKRHKIVDFPRGDLKPDSSFEILPTLLHIVTNETLEEVEIRIDSYKKDSEDDYEETDED